MAATKVDGGLRPLFMARLGPMGVGWRWTPIETAGTHSGVPDAYFRHINGEGWVEFKKTDGWKVELRPHQVAWHATHASLGGLSFIAVRQIGTDRDVLWLFSGRNAKVLCDEGLRGSAVPLKKLSGGPRAWSWEEVAEALGGTYR